jgi:hypothetical protein
MDARFLRAALYVAAPLALALVAQPARCANVRSEHFLVTAPSEAQAREVCQAAEQYRKDLAIEWLGRELPPWREPCPITVRPASGAGGVTSFMFDRGVPYGWTMMVQGPRERILDSVLPHEVTHTIFATHFGGPLPRWADEGACTTVEHASEKAKQDKFLIEFLHTDRGIPFNQMFAMKEYPQDMLPLYSQGYSLTRFLIQHGGKRKFINYVGDGMNTGNWPAATSKHYGVKDLSELQLTWVEWVRQGSPNLQPQGETALASRETPADPQNERIEQDDPTAAETFALARQNSAYGWQAPPAQNARTFAQAEAFAPPAAPSNFTAQSAAPQHSVDASSVSRPVSDGWYARQRDQAQGLKQPPPLQNTAAPSTGPIQAQPIRPASFSRPATAFPPAQKAAANRRVLMEWRKDNAHPVGGQTDVTGLALHEDGQRRR